MYRLLRPFLFALPPEVAHSLVLRGLGWVPRACFKQPQPNPVQAMGLLFPHRVGLAAGLDKDGQYVDALQKLNFAFIEVGTVTPLPQEGNPKPRLFRLPEVEALINRMGFNNRGVDALIESIAQSAYEGILGINIGKNKFTSLNDAAQDYVNCYEKVYQLADYVTINISSPNTPELRTLQQGEYLSALLTQLTDTQKRLSDSHQRIVPLVVKCSPDESQTALKHLAQVVLSKGIAGIIATNTTCLRASLKHVPYGSEMGGLSGRPLDKLSTACLSVLKQEVGDAVTLIASGGIDSPLVARDKIDAGATLLQLYTGLIYQGPGLVANI